MRRTIIEKANADVCPPVKHCFLIKKLKLKLKLKLKSKNQSKIIIK